jgi:hypothetical protein
MSVAKAASCLGFTSLGRTLPTGMILKGISFFGYWDETGEIFVGRYSGRDTAFFDYYAHHGDMGYSQTLVAIQSTADINELFDSSISQFWRSSEIKFEQAGSWIVMYRDRQQIADKDLEGFIGSGKELVLHLESLT